MSCVNVTNVSVLDNPSQFTNPFQFEITFECLAKLEHGRLLRWCGAVWCGVVRSVGRGRGQGGKGTGGVPEICSTDVRRPAPLFASTETLMNIAWLLARSSCPLLRSRDRPRVEGDLRWLCRGRQV